MSEQTNNHPADQPPPDVILSKLITGSLATHMVFAVARLGVADHLKDGPKSSDELAETTGAHPRALYRLLRGLTTLGVFAEVEPRMFALTPVAELLCDDADGSMRWWAIFAGEEWGTVALTNILYSVRTNQSAFVDRHGMSTFAYCGENPDAAEIFNNTMTGFSGPEAAAVLETYDFKGVEKIVDVAGGHGLLLSAILSAHPAMCGVLFDLPVVIEGARTIMEGGVSDRCEFVAGDFFESVPSGADAYILKSIIHDWSDERARAILRNIRSAIPDNGRLLLVERDLPENSEPSVGKIFDVLMLVYEDGFERTEAEYRSLLESCGFDLTRVLRTPSPMNVVEAVPV